MAPTAIRLVSEAARRMAEMLGNEVRALLGPDATFEERQNAAAGITSDVLWLRTDLDLRKAIATTEEVEVDGRRYRRLDQPSSATYYSCWGAHEIEEALYREVGVHNGPTIKPIERRVGMIARHMTPNLARIVGELTADGNSREVWRTLRSVGMVPPSRAFLEKRTQTMAGELAATVEQLEAEARTSEPVPDEIASVSCGMDRMAVRMVEPHSDPDHATAPVRTAPYERAAPEPKEHNYRMAWVGTATAYDDQGTPLLTRRYAAEADAEPISIARRLSADVAHLLLGRPDLPVHCVQDGAPELRILPVTLRATLPANANVRVLVDFEHLLGYLDDVVDACEPAGDPADMKSWHRAELLRDDGAIDRIWRNLRRQATTLPRSATAARKALAAALSYIRKRRPHMRYASAYAANLTIGSGVTEGTCGLMQTRVKLRGQSWAPPGLRGILTIRSLVFSDRWELAWNAFAATHRAVVRGAA